MYTMSLVTVVRQRHLAPGGCSFLHRPPGYSKDLGGEDLEVLGLGPNDIPHHLYVLHLGVISDQGRERE